MMKQNMSSRVITRVTLHHSAEPRIEESHMWQTLWGQGKQFNMQVECLFSTSAVWIQSWLGVIRLCSNRPQTPAVKIIEIYLGYIVVKNFILTMRVWPHGYHTMAATTISVTIEVLRQDDWRLIRPSLEYSGQLAIKLAVVIVLNFRFRHWAFSTRSR